MKKYLVILSMAMLLLCILSACDSNGNENIQTDSTDYIIQYTDNNGAHTINVTSGNPYTMEEIPEKYGHNFLGLFDSKIGGTQFIDSQGTSIAPFTDNKNMVLFPQYEPKAFKVILDYSGAPVTGDREISTSYNATIASLPTSLTIANKTFEGWYTQENCKGTQIADRYGVLPDKNTVTEETFDLTDTRGYIYLYAGFKNVVYNVTCYFESGMAPETVAVEHGTAISDIRVDTRVNGRAPLAWSKSSSGSAYTGRIEETNLVFYALNYAPIIEFDCDGGNNTPYIVSREGDQIVLPTPTRDNYAFLGWYTPAGIECNTSTMPSESTKLIAHWSPMLVFNERGGTDVDDIVATFNTLISLPSTDKEGYIFAGWYTETGENFNSTKMPENSTELEARYYREISKKYVLISSSAEIVTSQYNQDIDHRITLNVSDIYKSTALNVSIKGYYKAKHNRDGAVNYLRTHDDGAVSSASLIATFSCNPTTSWQDYQFQKNFVLESNNLYFYYYTSQPSGSLTGGNYARWSDFYIEIIYPDITQLY